MQLGIRKYILTVISLTFHYKQHSCKVIWQDIDQITIVLTGENVRQIVCWMVSRRMMLFLDSKEKYDLLFINVLPSCIQRSRVWSNNKAPSHLISFFNAILLEKKKNGKKIRSASKKYRGRGCIFFSTDLLQILLLDYQYHMHPMTKKKQK